MPKSSKKTRAHKGHQQTQHSTQIDFTLADFANAASPSSGRMKKGATNAWNADAKEICSGKPVVKEADEGDDQSWEEKDLDDFDLPDVKTKSELWEDEQGVASSDDDSDALCQPQRKSKKTDQNLRHEGIVYPVDIWFLVSDWIHPEDVCQFAGICRGAYSVAHSTRFWTYLYKRYFNSAIELPQKLQPLYMEKVHGMRTRVIRSLFFMYQPFQDRVKRMVAFENGPDCVENACCMVMWHQKVKNVWHFFFKFRKQHRRSCRVVRREVHPKGQLWQFESDLYDNPEEGCCVLQVVTGNYMSLPVVMGQTLCKSSVSVGFGMRYHKLKLLFTDQCRLASKSAMALGGVQIIMDPVINIRVLQWWDPKYPYTMAEHG